MNAKTAINKIKISNQAGRNFPAGWVFDYVVDNATGNVTVTRKESSAKNSPIAHMVFKTVYSPDQFATTFTV